LYALIGPGTYSSAMMNANELRTHAKAILVGQPTGGSPNAPGEVKTFTLPHWKCVQYSTKIWRRTNDNANTIKPDIAVEPTPKGFFADRDEVLEAVLKK
jgi:C-terminal processing protease CtpA/Prc